MKYLLIIALLCASLSSFSQHDTRKVTSCYHATQQAAIVYAAANVLVNADETVTQVELTGQTGAWCITLTITCNSIAANKAEEVPDVVKVIQSQECSLVAESTQFLE